MYKTLDDLKDKDKPASKKPGHFTGNQYSGQEIYHPDSVDDIIKQAETNAKSRNPEQKPNKDEQNCKITMFQNGFKVDDGEFRPYDDDANKKFMAELKEGNVPSELRGKYPNGLSVGLEDKRDEQFRPPTPPKYIAFSGQGVGLGQTQNETQNKIQQKVEVVNLNGGKLNVNQNLPKTKIQVRLHTGLAVEVEINNNDSVQTLYNHIQSIAPTVNGFQIVAGFPPKPIENLKQTIEDADLLESRVTQKLN